MPTVLLADDQEEVLNAIARTLRDEFQVVGAAENGMRTLDLVAKLSPDVLLLDISMPAMNGIEVALRLRAFAPQVRVIFLTVHQDPDMVEAALSAGACGYVLKPCLTTELVPAIWEVLGGKTFVSPSIRLH